MGKEVRIGTRVVRSARALPAGEGIPVAPPLVQSVAFDYRSAAAQDEVFASDRAGYVYGRYGTPTTAALETALAELEGTTAATCSGRTTRSRRHRGRGGGVHRHGSGLFARHSTKNL